MATCTWCDGTGFIAQGLEAETCPECLGTGEVDDEEVGNEPGEDEEEQ